MARNGFKGDPAMWVPLGLSLAVERGELPVKALVLWVHLARFVDFRTWTCTPSRATLARLMRCSERTVDRYLDILEGVGLIARRQRGPGPNEILILYTPPHLEESRFECEVDPNNELDPEERRHRAEMARRANWARTDFVRARSARKRQVVKHD